MGLIYQNWSALVQLCIESNQLPGVFFVKEAGVRSRLATMHSVLLSLTISILHQFSEFTSDVC